MAQRAPAEEFAAEPERSQSVASEATASETTSSSGWGDWSTFDYAAFASQIGTRASEALGELDVRAVAESIAERASEAARELELRADEAFGVGQRSTEDGSDGSIEGGAVPSASNATPKSVRKTQARSKPLLPEPELEPEPEEEDETEESIEPEVSIEPEAAAERLKSTLKELRTVQRRLSARENEIARRAAQRASLDAEQEALEERAAIAEQRLAEAESRVKELTEQCKVLKKRADSQASADMLVKEKDEIIKEVMAEGEMLSKKQAEMEGMIKKLRKELKEREEASRGMYDEIQNKSASMSKLSEELKSLREEYAAEKVQLSKELSEQKDYYLSKLAQAKEELTDVEVRANLARGEELATELKTAREREQSLKDQVADLQHSLQRSTAALERQEERFKNDLAAAEERCQAAESNHEELLRRMPESTRPLLRQIEALQIQATENTEAWAALEKASAARLAEAEARAEAAAERATKLMEEKMSVINEKQLVDENLEHLRAELNVLRKELESQREKTSAEAAKAAKFSELFAEQEGRVSVIEDEARERENELKQLLAQERGKQKQLGETWDRERAEMLAHAAKLESELKMAREEALSLHQDNHSASPKPQQSVPALMLTGGEAGLSLAVRDTLAMLKSQLAAKETELEISQDQIKKLEQTRDSLANELVKSEQLVEGGGDSSIVKSLEARYAAALEMIGERDEECEELRDRIQHLRSMLDSQARDIQRLEAAAR